MKKSMKKSVIFYLGLAVFLISIGIGFFKALHEGQKRIDAKYEETRESLMLVKEGYAFEQLFKRKTLDTDSLLRVSHALVARANYLMNLPDFPQANAPAPVLQAMTASADSTLPTPKASTPDISAAPAPSVSTPAPQSNRSTKVDTSFVLGRVTSSSDSSLFLREQIRSLQLMINLAEDKEDILRQKAELMKELERLDRAVSTKKPKP